MRWGSVALALSLSMAVTIPVSACDWDWCGYARDDLWDDQYWYEPPAHELPVYESPVYDAPFFYEPAYEVPLAPPPSWSDAFVWSAPGSDVMDVVSEPSPVAASPDPDARRAELGLHWVTDVYAGSSITTEGLVTTYSSSTVSFDAGTAAQLVASVGTGETSPYDSVVFNGRTANSGGALVRGDIYENRVWNGVDWIVDRYVFFQDDAEVASVALPSSPVPPPAVVPPPPAVSADPPPDPVLSPIVAAPAFVSPRIEDPDLPPLTAPAPEPTAEPAERDVRAGIALAPLADPLGRIEVLRGRRVALWVRATIDGSPARVIAWTLVGGDLVALGPLGGSGDEPLVATWRSVSTAAYAVRLLASVDVPGEGSRQLVAAIDVIVRSPAIVE